MLEEVNLTLDEVEAMRLADIRGMYQEDAAKKMGVSRQTFGNVIASARKKTADAILNGKALKISGGAVRQVKNKCCKKKRGESNENMHTYGR